MKSLGDQVREFREANRWDARRLAAEVGTSRQNIEGLERAGNRIPKYLGALAIVMKTPADVLLRRAGLGGEENTGLFSEETEGGYSIPVLATAASMGTGTEQHDDVVVGRLTLSPSWISRTLKPITRPENLRFIHGYGDSMEPTFNDGDILLVDAGVSEVKVDGIFVLEANARLYIKRVRQRLDGAFEISSDNTTVKTVDVLDGRTEVGVLGKVIWVWNGKKV